MGDLTTTARPRVRPGRLWVPHEIEDLHLAVPYRLAVVRLVDEDGLDPASLAAVQVADGVEEGGKAGGVHAGRTYIPQGLRASWHVC